jgi:hypothetical protein
MDLILLLAQDILPIAHPGFQFLRGALLDNIITLTSIPAILTSAWLQIPEEIWPMIYHVARSAIITGASSAVLRRWCNCGY